MDASAIGKRLIEERESDSLDEHLKDRISGGDRLLSSRLLHVELHRLGVREGIAIGTVDQVLGNISLVAVPDVVLRLASEIRQHVKSLDAIHLGTALYLEEQQGGMIGELITYDTNMIRVARQLGFIATSPGS